MTRIEHHLDTLATLLGRTAMYLAHLDNEKLDRAEQAAAFLVSLGNYWLNDQRVQVAQLLADLRSEQETRKVVAREARS